MWTAAFWKGTIERAAKTFAQGLASAMATGGVGLLSVGWKQALAVAGFATVFSLVTSVGSAASGVGPASPSLVQDQP